MTPERWAEVERLYHLAIDQPVEVRSAFVERTCQDPQVRQELLSLLAHDAPDDPLLDRPAIAAAAGALAEGGGPVDSRRAPGVVVGHYRLQRRIGQGGMGDVFLADDLTLHRKVALKFMPPDLLDESGATLLREARAASALTHPNLVTVHAVEEVDALRFIVMEYVEGETLKARLDAGPLSLAELLTVGAQVADGLHAAHEAGLIHRDIKPANIIFTGGGQAKVLDFGIARRWGTIADLDIPFASIDSPPAFQATAAGLVYGTVSYMSPEQARGAPLDPRSDVFSLGATLYEAATGRRPFTGADASVIVDRILHANPQLPSTLRPLPVALDRTLSCALAKRPEDRYPSAAAFAAALRSVAASTRRRLWWRRAAIAAAIPLAVMCVIGARYLEERNRQWAANAITEAERLAASRQYREAYALALSAERYASGNPALERVRLVAGDQLSVVTDPPGAAVSVIALADAARPQPERLALGVTPIDHAWLPRDDYLLLIEKDGYLPLTRTISSTLQRIDRAVFDSSPIPRTVTIDDRAGGTPRLQLDAPAPLLISTRLVPAASAPPGMVFVPGGPYQLVAAGKPVTRTVQLDDYFIDRYEVSNEEFRAFIAAGGYEQPALWTGPVRVSGRTLSWHEAMALFRDRTGRPGPRSWSNQQFAPGQGGHPVTDITWYEAAAYAAFRGRELPSVFQWEKAARDGQFGRVLGYVMPWGLHNPEEPLQRRANFQGAGPVSVGRFPFGVSPYGAYQMAGNVAEWCVNARPNGYTVAGGSWQDPLYLFGQYGSYPGLHAAPTIGFRTAALPGARTSDQGGMPISDRLASVAVTPIDEATYRTLAGHYRYDREPLEARVSERVENAGWTRELLKMAGPNGDVIGAYLYLPKPLSRPVQVLHYVPSDAVYYGLRVPDEIEALMVPFIRRGRAVFTVLTEGMTERPFPAGYRPPARDSVKYREQVVRRAIDLHRGLDYLTRRPEIDAARIAGFGTSIWSNELIPFALEGRYRTVVLLASGLPPSESRALPEANAVHFVPRIKLPVLMINGRYDESLSWDAEVEPLFRLLPGPKRLQPFDGGHMPALNEWVPVVADWLDQALGRR